MSNGGVLAGVLSGRPPRPRGRGASLQWLARNRPSQLNDEQLEVAAGMLPQFPLRPSTEPDPNAGKFGPMFGRGQPQAQAGALGGIQDFRRKFEGSREPQGAAPGLVEGAFPIPPTRGIQRPGFFAPKGPNVIQEVMARRAQATQRKATEARNRWQLKQETDMAEEARGAERDQARVQQQQQFAKEQSEAARGAKAQEAEAKHEQDLAADAVKLRREQLDAEEGARIVSEAGLDSEFVAGTQSGRLTAKQAFDAQIAKVTAGRLGKAAESAEDRRGDAELRKKGEEAQARDDWRAIVFDPKNTQYAGYSERAKQGVVNRKVAAGASAVPTERGPDIRKTAGYRLAFERAQDLLRRSLRLREKAATAEDDAEKTRLLEESAQLGRQANAALQRVSELEEGGVPGEAVPRRLAPEPPPSAPAPSSQGGLSPEQISDLEDTAMNHDDQQERVKAETILAQMR